jgi:hypothetical protein
VNGVGLSSYRYADLGRLLPAKVVEHVDGDTEFPFQFLEEFRLIEQYARANKKGLWQ